MLLKCTQIVSYLRQLFDAPRHRISLWPRCVLERVSPKDGPSPARLPKWKVDWVSVFGPQVAERALVGNSIRGGLRGNSSIFDQDVLLVSSGQGATG